MQAGATTAGAVTAVLIAGALSGAGRAEAPALRDTHENLHAVLWVQSSAEYQAIARGLYHLAAEQLDRGLEDRRWTAIPEQAARADLPALRPAIIVDVDETVLDNSPEEGQRILDRAGYAPELLRRWVLRGDAASVPGAPEFLRYAASRNVDVFLITNRDPEWRDATVTNLKRNGVTAAPESVLCYGEHGRAGDPGDKSGRRQFVAANHRVLLLLGDDLGDFVAVSEPGSRLDRSARAAIVDRYSGYWEQRWIAFPNPMYGSWERALVPSPASDADALKQQVQSVRGMPQ